MLIAAVLRLRSDHGLVTSPPNPPVGKVIWNMFFASGTDLYAS